jgi:SAM-dependent methyltransferase
MIQSLKEIYKASRKVLLSPLILRDYLDFTSKSKSTKKRFSILVKDFYPRTTDKTLTTGFDAHYVYHTSWAARVVARVKPQEHVDISSSLYFCGIVSSFVPVKFYDYRPANLNLSNLQSEAADLLALRFEDNSIASLSCMHTVEHIGLGRYGEPINPDGDLQAISELIRVLAPGGSLIFVTPVGKPKIQFNAHRIYSYAQIIEYFAGLELHEFTLIPDNAAETGMIYHATAEQADAQSYGCGCFHFTKKLLSS